MQLTLTGPSLYQQRCLNIGEPPQHDKTQVYICALRTKGTLLRTPNVNLLDQEDRMVSVN